MGPVWVAVLYRDADRTVTVQRVAAVGGGGGGCGGRGGGGGDGGGMAGDGCGMAGVDGWDDLDSDEAEVAAFFGRPACCDKLPAADAASPAALPLPPGGDVDHHGSPAWVDATLRRLAALALPSVLPPRAPRWWSGAAADGATDERTTGATAASTAADRRPDEVTAGVAVAGVAPRAFPVAVPSLCAGGCPGGLSPAAACPRVWAVACHVSPGPAGADTDPEAPPPAAALVALASGCHAPAGLGRVASVMDSLVVWSAVRAPWHARLGRLEAAAAAAAAAKAAAAVAAATGRGRVDDPTIGAVPGSYVDDMLLGARAGGLLAVDADDAGRSSVDSVDVSAAALSDPLEIARAVASVLADDDAAAARGIWNSAPSLRVAPSGTCRRWTPSPSPPPPEASPSNASVPDLLATQRGGGGNSLPLPPSLTAPVNSSGRVAGGSLALLRAVGGNGLLALLTAVLLEQRVALTAVSGEAAAWATVALSSLVAPLRWAHTLVPLLPTGAVEVLCAPTPLLVGVTAADAEAVPHLPVDELLVADLDSGDLTLHGVGANRGGVQRGGAACHMPRRLRASLLRHLRGCTTDADVESVVGVVVASLLRREAATGPFAGTAAAFAGKVSPPPPPPSPPQARPWSTPPLDAPVTVDEGRTSGRGGGGDGTDAPPLRSPTLGRSWSSRSLSSMASVLTASSRSLSTESWAPSATGAFAGATTAPAPGGVPCLSAGSGSARGGTLAGSQDAEAPPLTADIPPPPLRSASHRPLSSRRSSVSRLAGSYRSAVAATGLGGVKRREPEPDAFFATLRQTSAYAALADYRTAAAAATAAAGMGAGVGTQYLPGHYRPPRDASRPRQSVGAATTQPLSQPSRTSAPPVAVRALAAPTPRRSAPAPALGGGVMLLGDPLPPERAGASADLVAPVFDMAAVAEVVSSDLCSASASPSLTDVSATRLWPLRSASGRALSSLLGIK